MNWIAWIILTALLAQTLTHMTADALNLRGAEVIPPELDDLYSTEEGQKAKAYLKAKTQVGWIESILSLGLFLLFWFLKGFPFLDGLAKGFGFGPVLTGLVAFALLGALKSLFNLPFALYGTFVIEERFGFNRTTLKTFILDRIKGMLVGVAIGTPLLAGILAFFQHAGSGAWVMCWAVVTLFMLGVNIIVPTWIMPLFNTFTPLEEGDLKSRIMAYADTIGFPLQKIFVMDGSRRSTKANAFFSGFGKFRRIVLYDTLVNNQSTEEVLAVLAHEMGHFKLRHIRNGLFIAIAHTGILFYFLSLALTLKPLHAAFFMPTIEVYAGLIFFSLLYTPVEFLLGFPLQAWSRANEYQADAYAVQTSGLSETLVSSLKTLHKTSLSNLNPHPLYVALNHSHPPLLQRIRKIHQEGLTPHP
ncbi:M48 family metallopeptidase [Desulfoluna spongiiphila]|uniref:M48 family metallopeptidase n=1 Tax=Desulfoluna spongiiphila TaxID=419481 RepID=UPI001258D173|nr:M48 family metallopeptidase [Desulfoluna spongiiphila]VVS95276.1 peptidase m48 [Desulfoluna spongiiphila]